MSTSGAFVNAEVADEAPALVLAVTLGEELHQGLGHLPTREEIQRWFAEANAEAERRMLRLLLAVIATQALFTGVIGILMAVL